MVPTKAPLRAGAAGVGTPRRTRSTRRRRKKRRTISTFSISLPNEIVLHYVAFLHHGQRLRGVQTLRKEKLGLIARVWFASGTHRCCTLEEKKKDKSPKKEATDDFGTGFGGGFDAFPSSFPDSAYTQQASWPPYQQPMTQPPPQSQPAYTQPDFSSPYQQPVTQPPPQSQPAYTQPDYYQQPVTLPPPQSQPAYTQPGYSPPYQQPVTQPPPQSQPVYTQPGYSPPYQQPGTQPLQQDLPQSHQYMSPLARTVRHAALNTSGPAAYPTKKHGSAQIFCGRRLALLARACFCALHPEAELPHRDPFECRKGTIKKTTDLVRPFTCWCSAGNEGMTLINHLLWFPVPIAPASLNSHGCGSKIGAQHGTLVNGTKD